MEKSIKDFNKQFSYEPEIKNKENFVSSGNLLVVGMGGSGLMPKLLKTFKPELNIIIHQDYGLPNLPIDELQNKLIVLSSYSGNTAEVIDAFIQAKEKKLAMVVIAVGGELLSLAEKNNIPYIQLPDEGVQPRVALGLSLKAFLKLLGDETELKNVSMLANTLNPNDYESLGKNLALKLKNHIPIIYTSNRNSALAYIWKIKINETGKIPAFYNILPELNHNEMTSFDVQNSTKTLSDKFHFLFLKDEADDKRVIKRMEILQKLYQDRHLPVEIIELEKGEVWHKLFASLLLADWTAYYTALQYGLDPEQVPMVEEFKKLVAE